ncbi:hypothetical protein D9M73_44700 [compost metagenome]
MPPVTFPVPLRPNAPRKPAPDTVTVPLSARLPATSMATTPPVPTPVPLLIVHRSELTVPVMVAAEYCGTHTTCQLRTDEVFMEWL